MTASPVPPRPAGAAFFEWMRSQHIARGPGRWIGGVAAGLARRIGWDPALIRGLFVVAALFSGLGLVVYGAAWLLLPDAVSGRIHLEDAIRGRFDPGFWGGAGLAAFGIVYVCGGWLPLTFPGGMFWLAAVSVGAAVLAAYAFSRPPAPDAARPDPAPPPAPNPWGPPPPARPQGETVNTFPNNDTADPAPDAARPDPAPPPAADAPGADAPAESLAAAAAADVVTTDPASPDDPTSPGAVGAGAADAAAEPEAPPTGPTPLPDGWGAGGWGTASGRPADLPRPPAGRAKGGALTLAMVGAMLLVIAAVVALGRFTDLFGGLRVVAFCFGLALTMMGLGLIVLGLAGRRAGSFIAASIVLALVAVPVTVGGEVAVVTRGSWAVGSADHRPSSPAEAAKGFSVAIGEVSVDLTDPAILGDGEPTVVEVSVGIGQVWVVLPEDVPVLVNASISTGSISAIGLDGDHWQTDWGRLGGAGGVWRDRDEDHRGWVVSESQGIAGADVSLTAETTAAKGAEGAEPVLTVNCEGAIGQITLVTPDFASLALDR
jgi:phage shock protein PspC (stress-responsive transcriptional regulator)